MSDSPTTVALNIGSQRISVAVFETSKQGDLVLKGYESETIVADPAFEASREVQIQVALKEIVERLKISKLKVRYAISAQAVFMRFVKLPPIQDDNIEQLVTFEARQHVPFPLSEVVWDYELIEGSKEKEAVIVAIKSDELEEINDTVNSSGLATAEVDVAPMALYNAYRSAYGASDEPVLIVDIGAKTSSLLYVEGKRFFTRSVQIGGASISTAIAKEYRVPFGEAEHQKIHNGLVALGGGHTDSLDESMAALAMVIRNALTRLTSDITRTTNYYRSQHNGSAPKKVLLAGGGANLAYTLEFLEEKLGLPVEFFNPLTNIAIGKDVDTEILQREAHMMGELVGLGLRGIGKSLINIDLVPAAVEQIRDADRRKPFLIAAAAVLVVGFGIWALMSQLGATDAKDKARSMSDVKDKLSPHATKIKSLLKKEENLNEVATAYTDLQEDHTYWFNLLSEVNEAFANDSVWLTELTPVYGFNPIPPKDSTTPVAAPQQVITRNFANASSGAASLITNPPVVEEAPSNGKGKSKGKGKAKSNSKPISAPKVVANAIMIRGFWRENPRSQNAVSDLLKNLRENSTMFKFTVTEGSARKNSEAKEIYLSDEQLLKPSASGGNDDLGFPFELILPLAKPVAVK
jgi:type IV pilus assembly protein PilM